jgi:predicted Zn-dependent peptidase
MYATLFDDPDLINQMLPRYLSVTAEDIRSVSAEVFREDNRVILTYLPELPPADTASESEADADASSADEDEEVAA